MRFSIAFAVAALASTVSANLLARQDGLPACALQCITTADFGGCQATDNACLCKNDKFISSSTTCITTTCKGNDLQAALTAAQQLCAAVGVTLTSTPAALASVTNTGSPSAASTSAPASSTSPNSASMNGVSAVAGITAILAAIAL